MKMINNITFDGTRTAVSSSGNTEWFEYTITATNRISKSGARSIGQVHGMDGQTFSCQEEKVTNCFGDLYVYKCKAKCHSD